MTINELFPGDRFLLGPMVAPERKTRITRTLPHGMYTLLAYEEPEYVARLNYSDTPGAIGDPVVCLMPATEVEFVPPENPFK